VITIAARSPEAVSAPLTSGYRPPRQVSGVFRSHSLKGVSEGDAQLLKQAFNITTVRDLGTSKYFLWAQAVAKLAE
jgi:hypothetical protein